MTSVNEKAESARTLKANVSETKAVQNPVTFHQDTGATAGCKQSPSNGPESWVDRHAGFILAGVFVLCIGRPLGQIAAQIMEWGWGR